MANEINENIIDSQTTNETVEETVDESTEESTDETTTEKSKAEKPKRTPQEELDYFEGRAKRLRKDLGLEEETKTPTSEKTTKKSSDIDYAKLSYLETKGVVSDENQTWLLGLEKDSKIPLKELLGKQWVQAELKERLDAQKSADAVPKATRRSNASARDDFSVAYAEYEQTGKMPADRKLREQVLDAKIAKEKGVFS